MEDFKALGNRIESEGKLVTQKLFGMKADFSSMAILIAFQTTRNPESMFQNVGRNLTHIVSELFDQKLRNASDKYALYVRKQMQLAFQSTDQSQTLISYLSTLWYSRLPCFDVEGITSEEEGEKTMIKICKWKGKTIPCSRIFKKVTTDSGICCAFNMKEADDLFAKSEYTTHVKGIQEEEKQLAFKARDSSFDWYEKNSEPQSQAGKKMGLTVVLDAHSDYIGDFSTNSDFQGFTAMILNPGDFPLTNLNDFEIMPGRNNMVALTAMKVTADPKIRSIVPDAPKCYFDDETENIMIHKDYSQVNCLFECSLNYAQDLLAAKDNVTHCTPWAFPFLDANHRMCDPWEKNYILTAMENEVPEDTCHHCLPDCNRVIYQPLITTQKFRNCDENNFGVSELCNLNANIKPQIWGKQVLDQLQTSTIITKLKSLIQSSQRKIKPKIVEGFLFENLSREYDAYENDIAVLNVFFSSPTAIEYATRPSKSWFDFLSAVGGNGGLFIGFSIVTAVELLWVLVKMGKIHFQP